MEEEDYWNKSDTKAFSFDDDELALNSTTSKRKNHIIHDDNISEMSFELPAVGNQIPINLLLSDDALQTVLEEQSLDETQIRKGITPEEELRILRRSIRDRIYPPPVQSVISQLVANKPVALECFRSLQDKETLLDDAIASGHGGAVLAIVLFMYRTLKRSLVLLCLSRRPTALNHFIAYLRKRGKTTDISNLLKDIGRHTELALFHFDICMRSKFDGTQKVEKLGHIYREYFQQPGINKFYTQIVSNYLLLLNWQCNEKPNPSVELFDNSVIQTIYYSSSNHKWSDTDPLAKYNPQKLAEVHGVSQAQFEWVALNERAKSHAWKDLEALFEKKSWHSLKNKSFTISLPIDRVVLHLHQLDAPIPVLNFFLVHMSDARRRLWLARKVGASKSVTDALVELKDRQGLDDFVQTIPVNTESRFYAETALRNLRSKWNSDNLKLLKP